MKDTFKKIYQEHIQRKGADKLLTWLEGSDFFTAPASTRFHGAHEGGLVEHSVHVYQRLKALCEAEQAFNCRYEMPSEETIAIVGLLHDLCKVNFYSVEMRNRKNDRGVWEKYPFYVVNDQFPYGHGEKSVFIVSSFMKLNRQESMAIRWHMGGFDEAVKGGSFALSGAFETCPLAVLTHMADLAATYLDETREETK